MNMNQYHTNWQYGYTLTQGTDQTRGAYTQRFVAQSTPQATTTTTTTNNDNGNTSCKAPTSWADIKNNSSSFIGPIKPQAVVSPQSSSASSSESVSSILQQNQQFCARLHDLAVANHLLESYTKIEAQCTMGNFVVELSLGTESYIGKGPTVKAAKQDAARQALSQTNFNSLRDVANSVVRSMKPRPTGVTSTSQLHELATKKGITVEFKFIEPYNFQFKPSMRMWDKNEMLADYKVVLRVAGYEFYGQAELPQQAKHNAAIQALPVVRSLPDPPTTKAAFVGEGALAGKNVIMALNEIAMLNGLCPEWNMIGDQGLPHQKTFTWSLKLGEFEAVGTGCSKKVAKTVAAQQMISSIPEEWKEVVQNASAGIGSATGSGVGCRKKKKGKKRLIDDGVESSTDGTIVAEDSSSLSPPPPKKANLVENKSTLDESKPIYEQILSTNPISSLYEYCKKANQPDPEFECVSENVLETWQKGTKTFKKTEYTMRLIIKGKTYFESANTKKAAKNKVATEAWNLIRAGID